MSASEARLQISLPLPPFAGLSSQFQTLFSRLMSLEKHTICDALGPKTQNPPGPQGLLLCGPPSGQQWAVQPADQGQRHFCWLIRYFPLQPSKASAPWGQESAIHLDILPASPSYLLSLPRCEVHMSLYSVLGRLI